SLFTNNKFLRSCLEYSDKSENETVDVNGFNVLSFQVTLARQIFAEHPDLAIDFRSKNQVVKTEYMNVLLSLIEIVQKPPHSLSESELSDAHSELSELIEVGFKLEWLKKNLEGVILERKKTNDDGFRIQQLEEHVKNLELIVSDLKVELDKEKAKSDTTATAKLLSLEQTVSDLKAELDKERAKSATASAKIFLLGQTLSDLKAELDKEKAKSATASAKVFLLGQTLSDLKVEMDKKKEKSAITARVASLEDEDDDLVSKTKCLGIQQRRDGKVVHSTSEGSELFRAEIPGWGFRKAMPLRKLQDTELLEENKLIIEVYTTFSEVSRGYEYGQFIFRGQELVNFRGFHVIPCQVIPLSRIFAKHPNFAVHVNSKRKEVMTSFMNVLLDLIKTLDKPLESFTKTELYVAYNKLTHLSSAGFKLDWLKSKLDDISLEWKKENALARIQELEEKVKKLEIMSDDTMDDLNMERVKVLSLEKTVSDLRVELDKEKAKSDTKPTCMSLDKTVLDDLKVEMDKEEVKPDTDQPTCMSLDKTVLDDLRVEMDKEEVKPDTDQPTFLSLDKTMLNNLKVEMDKEEVKPDTDQPKVSSLKEDNVSSTKPERLGDPRASNAGSRSAVTVTVLSIDSNSLRLSLAKSFTWEIDNFSEKKSSIRSPLFSSSGYEWYVLLHPIGDEVDDHLSLYLCVANPKSMQPGWKKRASFRFDILNQSGKVFHKTSEGSDLFRAEIPGWGFRRGMPLTKLQDKELLENNKLIIEVYIEVSEDIHNGYESGQFGKKELVNFRGFHVLPSQIIPLSRIYAKHPNFAVHIKPSCKKFKTAYINMLLRIIETLDKPLESFSNTDIPLAYETLNDLTEMGFKLGWLKTKLDEISLEWNKVNAVARVKSLEETVRYNAMKMRDLIAELGKEKLNSSIVSAKVKVLEKKVLDLTAELDKEKAKSDTKTKDLSLEKTASVSDDLKVELDKEKVKSDTELLNLKVFG
ncbi:hypothetical protein AALP_AA4G212400, partial [Arabis alpina]